MRGWGGRLLLAAVASSSCASPPPLHLETSYFPVGEVCDRVHEVMRETDESTIRIELPAAAEMLLVAVRASGTGRANDCGAQLLDWLRPPVAARPIELRPRLRARIAALGTLVAADTNWSEAAADLLLDLLADEGKPIVHMYEEKQFLGPGSQSVPGWREAVTLDTFDRWVVGALRRGFADKAPRPDQWPDRLGDRYADVLARLFVARYAAPPSKEQTGYHGSPFGEPARSPPPEPARLGCGTAPLDLLWPDLVRVFRASPRHDRWDALSGAVGNRLRGPEAAPPCRDPR